MEDIKYIIVPDVHGRDFYIDTLDTFIDGSNAHMVFLGDYLDVYEHEGIARTLAIERFKHIIGMKKKFPDRITLLIGNHDLHYIDGSRNGCRMDRYNKDEICSLFINNIDLFDFVKCASVDGKNFVFSHAGFAFAWFSAHSDMLGIDDGEYHDDVEKQKEAFTYKTISSIDWKDLSNKKGVMAAYGEAGNARGGWTNHPSFMWADLSEILMDFDIRLADCIQIYGHTMRPKNQPVHFDNCYMLDCQNVFYINDKGEVVNSNYECIVDNGEEMKEAYREYYKRMSYFF